MSSVITKVCELLDPACQPSLKGVLLSVLPSHHMHQLCCLGPDCFGSHAHSLVLDLLSSAHKKGMPNILIGVTGSVAAIKVPELVDKLQSLSSVTVTLIMAVYRYRSVAGTACSY